MSKAKAYGLNFDVFEFNGTAIPRITCDYDENGSSRNHEMASFIEPNGVKFADGLLVEMASISEGNDYKLMGANQYEYVLITGVPKQIEFNSGTPYRVPAQDVIDILNEWKAFLQSLPPGHALSDH